MKKTVAFIIVAVLALTIVPTTAFGHRGSHSSYSPRYDLCTVENCDIIGAHIHDGKYYCGLCDTEDCYLTGSHRHDGEYYYGHYTGDGHDYHEACNEQYCTQAGRHIHDGTTYYSSCRAKNAPNYTSSRRGGRHH